VQTLCGRLELAGFDAPEISVQPGFALAQRGHDGSDSYELSCPPDQIVVGLHGGAGAALDSFGIECAPLLLSGAPLALTRGPITTLAAYGGDGGGSFTLACSGSSVARGSQTRVLDADAGFGFVSLEALGLVCGQAELR
jgi:hypothetical protein